VRHDTIQISGFWAENEETNLNLVLAPEKRKHVAHLLQKRINAFLQVQEGELCTFIAPGA
jgi:hypothetical protein